MPDILFQDNNIVVCYKPAGILSEFCESPNMVSILLEETKSKEIFTVHRLDKETSGLMVYAKDKKSAAKLSTDLSNGKIHKKYNAVICGCPTEKESVLKDLLFRDKAKNKSYVVKRMRKGVKEAILNYSVLDSKNGYSLIDIDLITGRTHQIRVQFSSRSLPLYGDQRYGGEKGSLALCAYKLSFYHPITNSEMTFISKEHMGTYPFNMFSESEEN